MHREVVNRSGSVLKFLSMMRALTPGHLDMMWRSCVGKAEAELVEEIHTVLAQLIPSLTPVLVVHLLHVVQGSAREAFQEAIAFTEKLAQLSVHEMAAQGQEIVDALLMLLWDLLKQPGMRLVARAPGCRPPAAAAVHLRA